MTAVAIAETLSAAQLVKLQTLWNVWWSTHRIGGSAVDKRTERLGRLTGIVGRSISSAKELTRAEAERAIGVLASEVPAQFNTRKKRPSRRQAQELGTAGRRGREVDSTQLAGQRELGHIEDLLTQLGWDQARFDGWMRSMHSPLGHRSEVRTLADANQVRWGLKRLLRRQRASNKAAAAGAQ
jgi:hypothetical protein